MLAQQNSKQKSTFFNLKPTVIDKLISKNKCSIQNNFFYSNEESDESLSEESEESWSSSRESSVGASEQGTSSMAPVKKNNKVGRVLGSKLSAKAQVTIKRGPGRPVAQKVIGKNRNNPKVLAAKKLLETRRGRPVKVDKDIQQIVKRKRAGIANQNIESDKSSKQSQKQNQSPGPKRNTKFKSTDDQIKKNLTKKTARDSSLSDEKCDKKSPRKTSENMKSEKSDSINNQQSPRKFPINTSDQWKATGLVIRGRGRPQKPSGVMSPGRRGGIRRGVVRADRFYNTRDSQVTGLMRSGKRRKLSDPNLVEGLDCISRKRSLISRIKAERSDCPSDEQSSFVTTSELSFCETENSLSKQSDDETFGTPKVDDTEDESTTDTNSNLFKNNKDELITLDNSLDCVRRSRRGGGRGRRRLMLGKSVAPRSTHSETAKETDDSQDHSELGSSPSSVKRHKKKTDGSWVRRSTRSIGKLADEEESNSDASKLLLIDKIEPVDSEKNSKSSLSCNDEVQCLDVGVQITNMSEKLDIKDLINTSAVIETPIYENVVDNVNVNVECRETSPDLGLLEASSELNDTENDSLVDFTLEFEETPIKASSASTADDAKKTAVKLNFETCKTETNELETFQICDDVLNTSVLKPVEKLSISTKNTDQLPKTDCKLVEETKDLMVVDGSCIGNCNSSSLVNDLLNEKLTEKDGNDQEILSDENIVSIIDSFCQSGSSDFTISDESQKFKDIIEKEQFFIDPEAKLCDNMISEVSNSLKATNMDCAEDINPTNQLFSSNKESLEFIETFKETNALVEPTTTTDDNCVTSSVINTTNQNEGEIDNIMDDLKPEQIIDDKHDKIEIDFASESKSVESSEESSSNDSNSHLMQLVPTTALENESEDQSLLDEKDSSEKLLPDMQTGPTDLDHSTQVCESQSTAADNIAESTINTSTLPRETLHSNDVRKSKDNMPSKELLSALGLQSSHSVTEEKPKRPNDSYTGTLKAVIKLNRSSDKKSGGRKMIFKQVENLAEDLGGAGDRLEYRICTNEEVSTEGVPLTHLGDIPANRKSQFKVKSQFDLSNSPNIIGAAGSVETPADTTKEAGKQNLVIPEKASSFSIHPERLCTDVCTYCFGKFGSLDTPCHLGQMKNSERQAKILEVEKHLSTDSCLCDGCFRYVDRKANCPTSQRSRKPAARRGPLAGTICAVQECSQAARHSVRRKWLIKLKKSLGKKLVIDMDKNPHLPVPLCSQHYYWVDYFTVCGICKKRLTRNHMYALGPEAEELNLTLSEDGIPVRLSDKLFLCKLCRYYSSLRLRSHRDNSTMTSTSRLFLHSYRKKILVYHDIPVSESDEEQKLAEEEAAKVKKKKSKSKGFDGSESKKTSNDQEKSDPGTEEKSNDSQMIDYSYLDTLNVHREQPATSTMDYNSLGEFEEQVGFSNIASLLNPLENQSTFSPDSANRSRVEKPTRIQVKFGNLNIGKLSNLNIGQDSRSTSTTAPSERPPFLPGERDLKLTGDFEFHGPLNPTSSWERCTSTIQFDKETKKMWQDLQRPYGNQSSFLRHLIMLEKYWRNGALVLSENPDPRAAKYINSIGNRVKAYDGSMTSQEGKPKTPAPEKPIQPEISITTPPPAPPPRPMSTPVRTTSAPPPLMKIPNLMTWRPPLLKKTPPPPPPYFALPVSHTSTSTATNLHPQPPPPYRFPSPSPPLASRAMKMTVPSPSFIHNINRNLQQQNIKPLSISYQQFKKIRLEKQPPVSSNQQITLVPKLEPVVEIQTPPVERIRPMTSTGSDFTPMICDVRSLAATTTTDDWNESFRQQQQKLLKQNVAKYYTPILPKVPNSLSVTTIPKTSQPQVVIKTSSLTIEKAPSVNTKPSPIPVEKPSISVFREPTPDEAN